MTKESITTALAIWGAIISTVALLWNILRALKDKGAILITANFIVLWRASLEKQDTPLAKALLKNHDPDEKTIDRFRITLFNTGRRPITVTEIRMIYSSKGTMHIGETIVETSGQEEIFKTGYPVILSEGEYHVEELAYIVVKESLTNILAKDANGKIYKLPQKELKNIKEQAESFSLSPEERRKHFLEAIPTKKKNPWERFHK